ncbi:hypothetical protein MASSI9I_40029 [Massilia sp. 9I]|nr:hypothetical protein MASSI9I_40029 [Massilia sp. 9I]
MATVPRSSTETGGGGLAHPARRASRVARSALLRREMFMADEGASQVGASGALSFDAAHHPEFRARAIPR